MTPEEKLKSTLEEFETWTEELLEPLSFQVRIQVLNKIIGSVEKLRKQYATDMINGYRAKTKEGR